MKSAILLLLFGYQCVVHGDPSPETKENYKDQYCTDPRTLQKHVAYSEWADAYSCTRHRCQPGGRNLAIYTVGCKRVEAPESAIECEEVVEDTNMQFPFCCTRLRCLVVVRGEVWTRVLGQPWETLPAAPWSHMYKMKKPPPSDTALLPKTPDHQGPVYELADPDNEGGRDKVLRSAKKPTTECPDCNDIVPRAAPPPPDIVIALSTGSEQLKDPINKKLSGRRIAPRHKRGRKSPNPKQYFDEDQEPHSKAHESRHGDHVPHETHHGGHEPLESRHGDQEPHEPEFNEPEEPSATDKNEQSQMWTELPRNQWKEPAPDTDNKDGAYNTPAENQSPEPEKKDDRRPNLQALVDAIGTRMRDIESVVLRMSEKVHRVKPAIDFASSEKRTPAETESPDTHQKSDAKELQESQKKRPSSDTEHYKRFSVRNRSKYLHGAEDGTTEPPLFAEETNGYYSDASNSVLRRASSPKEPMAALYMAPVDTRRSGPHATGTDVSEDDKKHKRHGHKKRKNKTGHGHKKRHKDDKKKHFAKFNSVEVDRNVVSLEDSSAIASS